MSLKDIVNVVISSTAPPLTQAGFGVPLILSHSAAWVERTRSYSSSGDVLLDFAAATPEYMAAVKIFSQTPSPPLIMIGRAALVPTQRFAISVPVAPVVGAVYALRLAGPSAGVWTSQTASYTAVGAAAWVTLTAYAQGYLLTADSGKLYICITAGTSSAASPPTGTAADITDGTVHWMYAGTGAAGATTNDAVVYNLMITADALAAPDLELVLSLQGSVGSKTLRILAENAGDFFGAQVLDISKLNILQDHADPGVATDLAAIALESSVWYGLVTLFNSAALVAAAAAWVESNTKLYPVASIDSVCATLALGVGSDIFQTLKASSYARTAPFFHHSNDEFADAAEIGRFFAISPGGDNWKMKTLVGVTAPAVAYTTTQTTNIVAKYGNYYYTLLGAGVIGGKGKVAANEYIDVIRFRDWMVARYSTRIAQLELNLEKIPFTDAGIALMEAEVRAQNAEGVVAGGIAPNPAPTVTAPLVASISSTDKGNRHLGGLVTVWKLAGAINDLTINASISN